MARATTAREVDKSSCPHIECEVCGFVENWDRGLKRNWARIMTTVMGPNGGDDGPTYLVCSRKCYRSAAKRVEGEIPFTEPRTGRPRQASPTTGRRQRE